MQPKQEISVWFFIGVLLAIYAVSMIVAPPPRDPDALH